MATMPNFIDGEILYAAPLNTVADEVEHLDTTKVETTATASQVYATNGSGTDISLPYTWNVVNNAIVQRTPAGQVIVPNVPGSNIHATSKEYVDAGDAAATAAAATAEANAKAASVPTTTTASLLYATNASGVDTPIQYAQTATANTIPQRNAAGQIALPATPTANTYAASKQYVDTTVAAVGASVTFTPVLTASTTAPTYGLAFGSYTLIGKFIHVQGYFGNISVAGSGQYQIMLPVPALQNGTSSSVFVGAGTGMYAGGGTYTPYMLIRQDSVTDKVVMRLTATGAVFTQANLTSTSNGNAISFNFTYQVA